MLKISLILGTIAALADVAGGLVLVRARGVERYLRYFVALGAGFLMATALIEMTPESLRLSPRLGPILIMAGYCVVHLLEHTINSHFHFGEETHHGEFVSRHTGNSVMAGLSVHALFDGVAIGSGFVVSRTVMPSLRRSATAAHMAMRLCGSRPAEGSSRNSTVGLCAM